jgi:hypothetical protein
LAAMLDRPSGAHQSGVFDADSISSLVDAFQCATNGLFEVIPVTALDAELLA